MGLLATYWRLTFCCLSFYSFINGFIPHHEHHSTDSALLLYLPITHIHCVGCRTRKLHSTHTKDVSIKAATFNHTYKHHRIGSHNESLNTIHIIVWLITKQHSHWRKQSVYTFSMVSMFRPQNENRRIEMKTFFWFRFEKSFLNKSVENTLAGINGWKLFIYFILAISWTGILSQMNVTLDP